MGRVLHWLSVAQRGLATHLFFNRPHADGERQRGAVPLITPCESHPVPPRPPNNAVLIRRRPGWVTEGLEGTESENNDNGWAGPRWGRERGRESVPIFGLRPDGPARPGPTCVACIRRIAASAAPPWGNRTAFSCASCCIFSVLFFPSDILKRITAP